MAHQDFKEWVEEVQPRKLVLLFHWDCDGLASAALFMNYLEEASPETEVILEHPTINRYFLVEEEIAWIDGYDADAVVVMDFNAPLATIEGLERQNTVYVFDNHSQTADIDRPGLQDINFPSASMLINDYLGDKPSLLAVLGAVGDKEEEIQKDKRFWPKVKKVMEEVGLDWDSIQRITKLVDTMYMLGDSDGLKDTVELLREEPMDILDDEQFAKNEKAIAEEMKRVLNQKPLTFDQTDDLVAFGFNSEVSVLSEATRAKAREYDDKVVLTWQSKDGLDMVYVRTRSDKLDCRTVTEFARGLGQNSGGKPEVAGIVLIDMSMTEFLQQIESFLFEKLS